MKAEILCVGTELLLGDIINTNAAYIAKELANIGIDVYYQSVVGDNNDRLKTSLNPVSYTHLDVYKRQTLCGRCCGFLCKESVRKRYRRDPYFRLSLIHI